MKKIAICMAKGGVGKTITAMNLSAALEREGKKVLLVDCDPQQGNATLFMGQNPSSLKKTLANIICSLLDMGEIHDLEEVIIPITENLYLLPANHKLEAIQNRMISENFNTNVFEDEKIIPVHKLLSEILNAVEDSYDYVIMDCSPHMSMLSINALVAADSVILPVEAHFDCYVALEQTLDVVARVKKSWNENLSVEGILITKYQSWTKLCQEVSKCTMENYGKQLHVFHNNIPLSIKAAELSGLAKHIFEHKPNSEVAKAYESLAKEVLTCE